MTMTDKEFKVASQKLIDTCKKHNFMERKIHPYSFEMTVEKLVDGWKGNVIAPAEIEIS